MFRALCDLEIVVQNLNIIECPLLYCNSAPQKSRQAKKFFSPKKNSYGLNFFKVCLRLNKLYS